MYAIGVTNGSVGSNTNQGGWDVFVAQIDQVGNVVQIMQYGTAADELAVDGYYATGMLLFTLHLFGI
jgi:hypothetical protein